MEERHEDTKDTRAPSEGEETVVLCWICGEPGFQPEDPEFVLYGGCHEICWREHEKTGKICQ